MKIEIPDNWNEVTISQYMEIKSLDPKSKDYSLQIIAVLIDKDPEEIRKYDKVSFDAVVRHLEWAMKSPDEKTYNKRIEVDGVTYTMIENLNGFSGGEWVDMEEFFNDYINNIHNIFAMIYRSSGEYDFNEVLKRAELFKEKVMIGQVYGASVFFWILEKKFMIHIKDYLTRQKQTMKKSKIQKKILSGTGIPISIRSRRGI